MDAETRGKISVAMKGRRLSDEHKRRLRVSMTERKGLADVTKGTSNMPWPKTARQVIRELNNIYYMLRHTRDAVEQFGPLDEEERTSLRLTAAGVKIEALLLQQDVLLTEEKSRDNQVSG